MQRLLLTLFILLYAVPSLAQETSPSPAASDEMTLFQDIPSVYSASKYEQKVTEAPSSVSIITADDIRKYGYRTLADILRSVRSFYVTNDRNYSYVGVRGFGRPSDYNSRILLLLDGHRTNDNIYDSAFIGTEGIVDVDIIDRIEVIRGPGSSLYGSNAFFAVLNIITKRGRDLGGAEISGAAASFGTEKGRLSYGNKFDNGFEALVSGSILDSAGQRLYYPEFDPANPAADARATNGGVADHSDNDQSQNVFTKMSYRDLTLTGAFMTRTKRLPTGAFGTDFNNAGNRTTDTRSYVDVKYDHSIGSQTDLTVRAFYDYYNYWGDYVYGGVVNKDKGYGAWWGGDVKLTTRVFDVHRIIVGAEYQDNTREDQQNYDDAPFSLYLDDLRASTREAFYVQDEVALSKSIMLNGGVRYDYYSTFGGEVNPRLAVIYTPEEKSSVKLLYGSAFRAPNAYEQFYTSPTSIPPMVANPDLKPETIETYEMIYERYIGDHFRGTVSGYYYKIQDLINQTTDAFGNLQYQNVDAVRTTGFEFELENKWQSGLEGRFSYSHQRSEDVQSGDVLTNSPEHLAKLNIVSPLGRSTVYAGIEEQYMSKRKTLTDEYAKSFYITNVTLFSRRLVEHCELSASVYNLFDTRYGDPVSADFAQNTIQQDGRNYRLKLTYKF